MKAIIRVFNPFILFLLVSARLFATGGDPMIEKTKTYNKSYAVNSSDKVKFDNRFGELKINTWDKNEVKVDITITAKADSEEIAQELLDRIKIEDGKSGSGVYFKTKVGDGKDWGKGNRYKNTSFSIDYVVNMPARNPLDASNEFGSLTIGDYAGEASLESKFGSLTAGKLSNSKNVHVEFGSATVAAISGGDLTIKFSRGMVSDVSGTVKANFEHGGVKLNLNNNLKGLTIKNSFSELMLDVQTNLSASFTVHTNFSELRNKTNFNIKEEGEDDDDRRGPKFDHDYSGKAGSGNIPIKVRSEFGDVIIGHNLQFDVHDEKDKKKAKGKVRTV